VKRPFELAD